MHERCARGRGTGKNAHRCTSREVYDPLSRRELREINNALSEFRVSSAT